VLLLFGASIYFAQGLPGLFGSYWGKVLFFPLLSIVVATGLPWLESIRTLGWSWLDRFVTYTSLVSYSLYLGHIAMLSLIIGILDLRSISVTGIWQTAAAYIVCTLAFYGFATVTYYFVEQPFMRLRDEVKH
jgi:peptidoglycan/LPS O-acetylase OafA/YrhL